MTKLTGKVAIVTGGYSGIGKAISEGLAEAGAVVVISARNLKNCQSACEEIKTKFGVKCLSIACDITRTVEVDAMVEATVKEFGRLDIIVNSAGFGAGVRPVVKMSDEEWRHFIDADLTGIFLCCRAAARQMLKQGGGKIINVASIGATWPMRNMAGYCAAKAGVVQFSRVMAYELVKNNIQVNVIAPGHVATPMNEEFFSSPVGKQMIERDMPSGKLGRPEDIKGLAVYLASSESDYMTGAYLIIDGGQSLH